MTTQAQIQTQPQPQQPQFPVLSPYAWQDIGIIGFVVVSFAIALGKWLPSYLDKRWVLRQREIEIAIAGKEQAMKAELLRDERDQKLVADLTNTLLAKELQRSEELLEIWLKRSKGSLRHREFSNNNSRQFHEDLNSPPKIKPG